VAATAPRTAPTLASLGLAVLCVSQFVDVLSVNTAIIALPDIRADLGMGAAGAQWVISVYALLFGSLLLFAGRLADRAGAGGGAAGLALGGVLTDLAGWRAAFVAPGVLAAACLPFVRSLGPA
jgi:MFS family permease